MSDLFHRDIPLSYIRRVFETMADCPQHTFQILTKRSDGLCKLAGHLPWAQNIWMGVSVEDSRVLYRVDDLRTVAATVRFLSCEPLIGSLAEIDLREIHLVIVGGESGRHARPVNTQWCARFSARADEKGPFLFQALGWRSEAYYWSIARWQDLGADASAGIAEFA